MSLIDLLGTRLPLIQAPMAGVQDSTLALAVCHAGGLGSLPAALLSPQQLRLELARLRDGARGPYNVNFFCHQPPAVDPVRDTRWRAALQPYYDEFELAAVPAAAGPLRTPFDAAAADLVDAFRPAVVSFHFGLPAPALLARVCASGARIGSTATTLAEARWLAEQGVDFIIAQGLEAGGHRSMFLTDDVTTQVGTSALVQQLVHALDCPIVAAGGISDAAGVRAALALGAAGVQIGTAYLLCPEATTSAIHRQALASEAAQHTALTTVFSGRPARGIVNRAMRELGLRADAVPAFPLASAALAPLRAHAEAQGSGDFSPLWAGQSARACREVSAAELTRSLFAASDAG